jgi:cholesterol transport system auxiliary component
MAALLLATLAMSGCALMNGGKPSMLYRLGASAGADPVAATPSALPIVILYPGSSFARPSEGDQILTVTGNEAAYIAQARWVAPAKEMFDSETIRQLERGPIPVSVAILPVRPMCWRST